MTLSERLVDLVLELEFDRIPPTALSSARKLLLDHFCVAAVGASTPWGQAAAAVGRETGGVAESSVYFSREKLPARTAAFVNGTFAHGFELDDHGGAGVHPGVAVIPAAIAAGEKKGVDGRTLVGAIVAGYEVLLRLSLVMGTISNVGHHPTGTMGAIGATVAAGRALGLGKEQLVSALGLAGNFPTGVCEFYRGGMEKRFFAGRAAEAGLLSCLLASKGVIGAQTIFEGELGFCHAFSRNVNLNKLLEGLGQDFYINNIIIKRYPCAGWCHHYIDAAAKLHESSSGMSHRGKKVSAVAIEGRKLTKSRTERNIKNVTVAQYSVPYAVAVTLCHGRRTTWAFSDEAIHDPGVQAVLDRVQIVPRDDYPGFGRITVTLEDGTMLAEEVVIAERPVTQFGKQEIIDKAVGVIAPWAGARHAREMVERLDNMVSQVEAATDIRQVLELMPVLAP